MSSNVGSSGVYEAGDQRNPPDSQENKATPFQEGEPNAHDNNDPKDQRSIANRLASAKPSNDSGSGKGLDPESLAAKEDPTLPAKMHGNEPSRGAKIDKEIADEEAEIIAKKDARAAGNQKGGTGKPVGQKNG